MRDQRPTGWWALNRGWETGRLTVSGACLALIVTVNMLMTEAILVPCAVLAVEASFPGVFRRGPRWAGKAGMNVGPLRKTCHALVLLYGVFIMIFGTIGALQALSPKDEKPGTAVRSDLTPQRLVDEKAKKGGFFKGLMQDKAAHKIFPVFWLVCVSLAVFQYIMDIRATSYEVAPNTSFIFEILVPLSLAIFSFVALGDPGKVPSRPQGNSGVEELMKALDSDAADIDPPDVNRLCTTTWVLKGLRTKYCVQTGACLFEPEFDHYCVWLNNTIGKGNHRQFVGLAVVEFLAQMTHIRLCLLMASSLVPYQSFGQFMWGVITGYPLLTLIVLVHCITGPWVFMLTLHQARLVMMNLTTNEMMNMHRYEHFWVVRQVVTGHAHKSFRNPFNKGSAWKNCLDFWWYRRRGEVVPQAECCSSGCGHSH
eukprot:symbB.v1.2.010844.t1/scaffold702.1/size173641/2